MWDVFISHASEDKEEVARPLASLLTDRGLSVWFDEFSLVVGDSLSEAIDRGLAASKFGVLILSPAFFAKPWPRRELRGLTTREVLMDQRVLLPIWHGVSAEEVAAFSLPLADLYAVPTTLGLEDVSDRITNAVSPDRPSIAGRGGAPWQPPLVHPGFLDPIRPGDFETLRRAFERPLDPDMERALILVPSLARAEWGHPLPEGFPAAFYSSMAEVVRAAAKPDDRLFQVAEDEVGLLVPQASNHEMVTRISDLSWVIGDRLSAAAKAGPASPIAVTLGARWTVDLPFWDALRRLRGWVAETRAAHDHDGYPTGLSASNAHASQLNI